MDAGKLSTRLQVIRQVKTADGYGGNFSTEQVVKTIWAKRTEQSGDIGFQDGQRRHYIQSEFIIRKKTAENILDNDILQVEGETNRYRLNNKYEFVDDFYIKIFATKIEKVAFT
jgi:head-tail adaptor